MNDKNPANPAPAPSAYRIATGKIIDELENERAKARASGQDKDGEWWIKELLKRAATIEHLMSPAERVARLKDEAETRQRHLDRFKRQAPKLKEYLFKEALEGDAEALGWYLEEWKKRLATIRDLQTPDDIRRLMCLTLEDGTTLMQIAEKQNNREILDVIAAYQLD